MQNRKLSTIAKILAVTAFVATAAFAMIPKSTANISMAFESSEAAASAALYRANCARCHGNDGHSNTKDGRRTEADDLTDASVKSMSTDKMTRIIKNGKGEMPANKKLSAAQVASIVRYVRGL